VKVADSHDTCPCAERMETTEQPASMSSTQTSISSTQTESSEADVCMSHSCTESSSLSASSCSMHTCSSVSACSSSSHVGLAMSASSSSSSRSPSSSTCACFDDSLLPTTQFVHSYSSRFTPWPRELVQLVSEYMYHCPPFPASMRVPSDWLPSWRLTPDQLRERYSASIGFEQYGFA
jgi:hypothetical protein